MKNIIRIVIHLEFGYRLFVQETPLMQQTEKNKGIKINRRNKLKMVTCVLLSQILRRETKIAKKSTHSEWIFSSLKLFIGFTVVVIYLKCMIILWLFGGFGLSLVQLRAKNTSKSAVCSTSYEEMKGVRKRKLWKFWKEREKERGERENGKRKGICH